MQMRGSTFTPSALGRLAVVALFVLAVHWAGGTTPPVASADDGTTGSCASWAQTQTIAPSGTSGPMSGPNCCTGGSAGATGGATGPTGPSGSGPCWTDVEPYPFGADGEAVDTNSSTCAVSSVPGANLGDQLSCYLVVTSLAFRAYNRGLAATSPPFATDASGDYSTGYGVWEYTGDAAEGGDGWFPVPGFPGSNACPGTTVVWAGKLDFWLIGASRSGSGWPSLCRYDGANDVWEPLPVAGLVSADVPLAVAPTSAQPNPPLSNGAITSAACFSWDNCWFFGSFGVVLHWNGTSLSDESPPASEPWLDTAYTSAIARVDTAGNPFGVAVGLSSPESDLGIDTTVPALIQTPPDGSAPPQVFTSDSAAFGPLPIALPVSPWPQDPYRTDLVAADFTSSRDGWMAADAAGTAVSDPATAVQALITEVTHPAVRGGFPATVPEDTPVLSLNADGGPSSCAAPSVGAYTYAPEPTTTDAYRWLALSAMPDDNSAIVGGQVWPVGASEQAPGATTATTQQAQDGSAEPAIVQVYCDGSSSVTRFFEADPLASVTNPTSQRPVDTGTVAPVDRGGAVSAVAANAPNDAWAATTWGGLDPRFTIGSIEQPYTQAPHLYRLTDGETPRGVLPGDDDETRPLDVPIGATLTPLAAPPAPTTTIVVSPPTTQVLPPPVVRAKPTRDGPTSVYDIRTRIVGKGLYVTLVITFRLRAPVTLGAQATRGGRVVSSAPLHHFTGRSGTLTLRLDTHEYPTGLRFTTDQPVVELRSPGRTLRGTVNLTSTARPFRGRRVLSVSYQYDTAGSGLWYTIGQATTSPWRVAFVTAALKPGRYDLRAVATDSAHVSGISAVLKNVTVAATAAGS